MPTTPTETILIVEDDTGLARLQVRRLERSGFATVVASDFEEAIDAVRRGHIDLILLDYQLPGGRTGLDIQAALVGSGYDLPVVVVTGHHDEATIIKALRAGVRDFVTKSDSYLDYLADVVERVLKQVRTERRLDESQALLAGVVSSTIDAIITLDAQARVMLFNEAAERMFGCSAAAALGQPLERFVCVDQGRCGDAVSALYDAATRREARWEVSGLRQGGVRFPMEASVSEGEVGGSRFHTLVLRDVSAQKEMEETLRTTEQRLRQSQKLEAVGSLAGGVAHEFNNLLQAILGYTAYAMKGLDPADQRYDDLAHVVKAGRRAATLTRQLLSFSRRQDLQRSHVNVKAAVDEFTAMTQPLLGENIELQATCADPAATIHVDPGEFQQVLLNLAINARDAMPHGGRLTIASESVELGELECLHYPDLRPGEYAKLTVADNGAGIPPEAWERIFEPFFTTKEVGKGTGLGLAMVHGMVSQHQGSIGVYSQVGVGTTFCIYLPLARVAEDAPVLTMANDESLGGSETIFVAEDEPLVLSLVVRILEDAGYRTICAVDGEEALRLFLENRDSISLALIDLVMPKMGGVQLYHRLMEFGAAIPVVFCSGHAPSIGAAEVIREQRHILVQKPYAAAPLLRAIRNALDAHAAQAAPALA